MRKKVAFVRKLLYYFIMKKINAQKIKKLLKINLDVKVFDEITSTNIYAENMTCGAVFALRQTNGQGRNGKKFFSGFGGLYFSLAFPLHGGIIDMCGVDIPFASGRLTISAGIAVAKTLISLGYDAKIKWVNDVFVSGKKVCGILARGLNDKAIIGIGLNLNSSIPFDISDIAASLDYNGDYNQVAAALINGFANELLSPDMRFFNEHCFTIGKTVKFSDGIGKAISVADDGALLIETEKGIKRVFAGEATILD